MLIRSGHATPGLDQRFNEPQVGVVNGLAVSRQNAGVLVEIEVCAVRVGPGKGNVTTTGVVEEEETRSSETTLRRKSMVKGAIENVLTVLRTNFKVPVDDYDIHINFPGGMCIDGPSAGVALVTAIYSAIKGIPVDNRVAITGEVSIRGVVKAVGGVFAKIRAAREAGVQRIYIPKKTGSICLQIWMGWQLYLFHIEQIVNEVFVHEAPLVLNEKAPSVCEGALLFSHYFQRLLESASLFE